MTRIDFYVFSQGVPLIETVLPTVCRICEKAGASGQRVYIHSQDKAVIDALDSMLWSFRQGSFVSHERISDDGGIETPMPAVLIGNRPPADHIEVMINLATDIPSFFSRFERVLEVVLGDASARASGRLRYRYYKDRGYPLSTHDIAISASRHATHTKTNGGDGL